MSIHRVRLTATLSVGIVSILGAMVACKSRTEWAGSTTTAPASTMPQVAKAAEISPVDDWTAFTKTIQPFIVENCASCHGETDPEAGVRLTFADADALQKKK